MQQRSCCTLELLAMSRKSSGLKRDVAVGEARPAPHLQLEEAAAEPELVARQRAGLMLVALAALHGKRRQGARRCRPRVLQRRLERLQSQHPAAKQAAKFLTAAPDCRACTAAEALRAVMPSRCCRLRLRWLACQYPSKTSGQRSCSSRPARAKRLPLT